MLVIEYLPIITFLWNEAFGLQLIQTSYTTWNGFGNPAVGFDVFEFMCKFYASSSSPPIGLHHCHHHHHHHQQIGFGTLEFWRTFHAFLLHRRSSILVSDNLREKLNWNKVWMDMIAIIILTVPVPVTVMSLFHWMSPPDWSHLESRPSLICWSWLRAD